MVPELSHIRFPPAEKPFSMIYAHPAFGISRSVFTIFFSFLPQDLSYDASSRKAAWALLEGAEYYRQQASLYGRETRTYMQFSITLL